VTTATSDVTYLLLADRASPYLLARVRWPDVAQAITKASQDWLDDPGLFDLPYEPSAVKVSFPQAASVAAAWGRQLRPQPDYDAPSFIRRMPANWSDLSHAERRALGIESVAKRRSSAPAVPRLSRLRTARAKIASAAANRRSGNRAELAAADQLMTGVAANGHNGTRAGRAPKRRLSAHVRVLIRCGDITISAGLVELSEGGMECVLPEARPQLAPGAQLSGPFLLELQGTTTRICLDVPGRISWERSTSAGVHFRIVFDELPGAQTDGVRRFLAAASSRGPR
jgi:hypothetical protein